jgi:hypothetical protein
MAKTAAKDQAFVTEDIYKIYAERVDERGQRKRVRRAFTKDELHMLVQGSGSRGIIYFTAPPRQLRAKVNASPAPKIDGSLHRQKTIAGFRRGDEFT